MTTSVIKLNVVIKFHYNEVMLNGIRPSVIMLDDMAPCAGILAAENSLSGWLKTYQSTESGEFRHFHVVDERASVCPRILGHAVDSCQGDVLHLSQNCITNSLSVATIYSTPSVALRHSA
jgi:hypothetical protein